MFKRFVQRLTRTLIEQPRFFQEQPASDVESNTKK
jgi:hypothetical protein